MKELLEKKLQGFVDELNEENRFDDKKFIADFNVSANIKWDNGFKNIEAIMLLVSNGSNVIDKKTITIDKSISNEENLDKLFSYEEKYKLFKGAYVWFITGGYEYYNK